MFLVAGVIVTAAFTPWGFWGWLWHRVWLVWEVAK